jgi:hypothetical protein
MKKSTERVVWIGGAAAGAAALVGILVFATRKSSTSSGGGGAGAKGPNGQPLSIKPFGSLCPPGQVFIGGRGCTPYVAPAPPPSQSGSSFILDPNNRNPQAYNSRGGFSVTTPHASVLPGSPVASITGATFSGGVTNPLAAFQQFPTSQVSLNVTGPGTATFTWQTQAFGQTASQYTTVLTFV